MRESRVPQPCDNMLDHHWLGVCSSKPKPIQNGHYQRPEQVVFGSTESLEEPENVRQLPRTNAHMATPPHRRMSLKLDRPQISRYGGSHTPEGTCKRWRRHSEFMLLNRVPGIFCGTFIRHCSCRRPPMRELCEHAREYSQQFYLSMLPSQLLVFTERSEHKHVTRQHGPLCGIIVRTTVLIHEALYAAADGSKDSQTLTSRCSYASNIDHACSSLKNNNMQSHLTANLHSNTSLLSIVYKDQPTQHIAF
jgi:hypothetical protein